MYDEKDAGKTYSGCMELLAESRETHTPCLKTRETIRPALKNPNMTAEVKPRNHRDVHRRSQ